MIIGKKNSVNLKYFTNSSKNQNQNKYKNINNSTLMEKTNIYYSGNAPIKVNLIGKNPKNIKKLELINDKINQSLISSFHLKKFCNDNNSQLLNCSSSFHKKNCKIIIPGEKEIEDGNDKNNDKQKNEIKRLKELLNATKEIKNNNNLIIKNDFKKKIRYNTENNENMNEEKGKEEKNNREIKIIKSNDVNSKKRKILNINIKNYNKNINKEKIYYLIYKKNKILENKNTNCEKDKKYNKNKDNLNENNNNGNNNNDNNNEDNYSKSEKKKSNVNKFKIRNILSKNFINNKSKFNTLELLNINNHKRKNRSPEGKTYIKTVSDLKENKNEIETKSLNSNNSKDTFKITSSINTKPTTSNITEKRNNLRNNILFYNNYFSINNNINVINNNSSTKFQTKENINNDNLRIKEKYFNSPQKFDSNITKNKTRNSLVLKFENNKSVELKSKLNKFKSLNNFENRLDINNNDKNQIIDIKFDELILYEERLNDIYIAINSFNKMEGGGMNNECLAFFKFYLNSTLNNKLSLFFSEDNNIIIQSSINLQLFIIMLIFHLSFYSSILSESIILLIDIFTKLKHNFYLLIKQILTYYNNINFFELNENKIYFNIIINLLKNTNIYNINNLSEDEIIIKINNNCTNISNNIHNILNLYYEYSKNNNNAIDYYNELLNIFNQLSIISENDITNYFYNNIYKDNSSEENEGYNNRKNNIFLNYKNFNINKKYRNRSPLSQSNFDNNLYHQNNTENNVYKNQRINSFVKEINNNNIDIEQNDNLLINNNNYMSMYSINPDNIINKNSNINIYNSNPNYLNYSTFNLNISIPFIKSPKPKNKVYTLILDLDETLVHVKQIKSKDINYNFNQKIINLRPGLFSFLNTVKPYYEIISFSSASKGYVDSILKKIETNQKYFDHNLYREHTTLYGEDYVKDISKIGRNIKKMVIVDNLDKNFKLNPDNGIKISPYFGEVCIRNEDNKLYELQKLLILFYKLKYEDLRMAIKDYSQFIKDRITNSN